MPAKKLPEIPSPDDQTAVESKRKCRSVLVPNGANASTAWKKGHCPNPKGRPKGARDLLSKAFIEKMLKFWRANGQEALQRTLEQNPAALVATIARLVPKDFQVTVTGDVTITHDLSDAQREKIAESWMLSQFARRESARTIEGKAEIVQDFDNGKEVVKEIVQAS